MSERSHDIVLSLDELRALARVEGLTLPPWTTDDDPVDDGHDAVALRGLLARGLVERAGDDPADGIVLAASLGAAVAPLGAVAVLAEVGTEDAEGWAVLGPDDDVGVVVATAGPGLAGLTVVPDPAAALAAHVGLDAVAEDVAPDGLVVPLGVQAVADDAALDGDVPAAVGHLVAAGAPPATAHRWVDAVTGRRGSAAVQVARPVAGTEAVRAAELHWLVAADGTAWTTTCRAVEPDGLDDLLDLVGDLGGIDDEDRDSLLEVVIGPTTRADLRSALARTLACTPTPDLQEHR